MRNMKKITTAGAILLMTTSIATAGGIDRSGQSVAALFEDGNYAELSFGLVMPDVSGTLGGANSGNMTETYSQLGMAYKTQVNEQVSLALIFDNPFGADVDYEVGTGYALQGANAEVLTQGVTALGRYEITPSFSVHGGVRYIQANGVYDVPAAGYTDAVYNKDGGVGYVLGGAYERDDIALRVALTYSSEIELELDGTAFAGGIPATLTTTLPESVNLEFQTGIAADTLLFGSVRYVAWDGFSLDDSNAGSILSYDDDVYTYNIGVGRRFSDAFAGSVSIGYEAATGELTGELGPTDGYISLQVGGAYTMDNGVEVSGGVHYVQPGDAMTGFGGDFADNSAVAIGLKVGYGF
jgi:long-chain fatty acid transport protein